MHVDVALNDWHAGFRRRVAVFYLTPSTVKSDVFESDFDDLNDLDAVTDFTTGATLNRSDGEAFLHHLRGRLESSYVFVTDPHDEHDCPFNRALIPLDSVAVS